MNVNALERGPGGRSAASGSDSDLLHVMKWHNGEKEWSPFSDGEMARRHNDLRGYMAKNGIDAALLQQALGVFGVQPRRAVMIGDGKIDIDAGKQAGVITCGVTYGFGDEEDIAVAMPDLVVRRLSDLPRYVY